MKKTVAILGSTGSVGRNALKVIWQLKDKFKVVALAAGSNASLLARQINKFCPRVAAIMDGSKFRFLKKGLKTRTRLFAGQKGIAEIAGFAADIVVMAIGGSAALIPTLKSLEKCKRLALANKESLVMAGDIIMRKSKKYGVEIIPVDSEHSAIFQCLKEEESRTLEKIYLTGSGGPLNDVAKSELEFVEPDLALSHPRWKMGRKISIDSATLMNKGLEIIEASCLFGLSPEKIEVLIHPQAIIHSLVQFVDGTILGQLGAADMRIPIQYALTYPKRIRAAFGRIDLVKEKRLSFHSPDLGRFPCLKLAMQVARQRGLNKAALCAADEECVFAYLSGKIRITDFARTIERVLAKLKSKLNPSLKEILEVDSWAREEVKRIVTSTSRCSF